ncbi:MAG: 16S rRNA (cytosine(967)-C(5))-methyltransferase RsmB [Gemmatimonadetes bacterium]|nr:16S rRNA (cytosine(967)-C(5))-methyltransferase RsmB [Gemmatimonadota bacterium]MYB59782.1 16S rRNA (cytosine(967)-C(5))-methyltransferase RsmB [Gemmatimonadota bacterium]
MVRLHHDTPAEAGENAPSMRGNALPVREIALKALYRAETRDVLPRDALNALFRRNTYSARDRAFATELVYGTIRWRRRLDWTLARLLRGKPESLTPWIRLILHMGLYQLMMMDQVPSAAATHESVQLAKRYGHEGTVRLTNAVLRTAIRQRERLSRPPRGGDPVTDLGVTHSYPDWLAKRWIDRYGMESAAAIMEAGNRPPSLSVRVNTARSTPQDLAESLAPKGIQVEPGRWLDDFLIIRHAGDLHGLSAHEAGLFQVQDESAGLAVRLLGPQAGETVVDLCCAPGGKTTYIAQIVGAGGKVIACDSSPHRLRRVEEHRQRMGLGQVRLVVMDGRSPGLDFKADRVLVDAPCSGLGTIARRPDLRWRRTAEDIGRLRGEQLALLEKGAGMVKPGGVLVYSTCTIEPEENEDVVAAFCSRHPGFRPDSPGGWPAELAGVMDGAGRIATLPPVHGVDGSFAARLRNTG